MIEFAVGVVVGAAFSPFWLKVWGVIKSKFVQPDPHDKGPEA
jgi:hypothetical protein